MTYITHLVKNRYAVDYLTLTTFDEDRFLELVSELINIFNTLNVGMEIQGAKRLQYNGFTLGGMFWGEAMQNSSNHFMIDIKGGWADIAFRTFKGLGTRSESFSCSRIDIQVTREGYVDMGLIHQCLQSGLVDWRGRRIVHKSNLGLQEWDSVTFGGKIADIKSILYIKDLGDGVRGVRHEVRYRGKQAKGLFNNLLSTDNFMALIKKVMFNRLKRFPEFFEILMNEFYKDIQIDDIDFEGFRFKDNSNEESTLNWFLNCVVPSVIKLLDGRYSDETGKQIVRLYQYWLGEGLAFDISKGVG